jgi:hypothetical protein
MPDRTEQTAKRPGKTPAPHSSAVAATSSDLALKNPKVRQKPPPALRELMLHAIVDALGYGKVPKATKRALLEGYRKAIDCLEPRDENEALQMIAAMAVETTAYKALEKYQKAASPEVEELYFRRFETLMRLSLQQRTALAKQRSTGQVVEVHHNYSVTQNGGQAVIGNGKAKIVLGEAEEKAPTTLEGQARSNWPPVRKRVRPQ